MRTHPAHAMTIVYGRPTHAVADTAARRSRRVLSGLTAAVLAIGGLALSPLVGGQTEAQAADLPQLANTGTDPGWTEAKNVEAVWLNPLVESSVYWTNDNGTGNPGTTVGTTQFILGESYDFTADSSSYKTRTAMLFLRKGTGNDFSTNAAAYPFSSLAIARIGGEITDPDAPLTIYMWSYYNDYDSSTAGKTCPTNYMHITRVTSGDPKVWLGCAPRPYAPLGFTDPGRIGGSESSGGEADQVTGYLYFQAQFDYFDNKAATSTAANTSPVQFQVWNPETGAYTTSGPVQPADWYDKTTTVSQERQRLLSCSDPSQTCTNAPYSAADFGLDASGNIYIYAGNEVTASSTKYTANLIRIVPAKDASGKFLNGTAATPWKYNVVTKVKSSGAAGQAWSSGYYIWGTGIHDGLFLLGANVSTSLTGKATGWVSKTPATMVRVDPLSGLATVVGTSANETLGESIANNPMGAVVSGTPTNGSTYYPVTAGTSQTAASNDFRDNASGEQLNVINGTVYDDANGNGIIESTEKPLSGVTVALYDSSSVLKGTLVTGSTGTYSFIVSGYGKYFVRVVQPKVNGVNAVQTWASGTAGALNPATAECVNGDITTSTGASCGGALTGPFADPDVEPIGKVGDRTTWPIYSTVDMNSYASNGNANFGVTTFGSYGDAAAGPATGADGAPFHVNAVPASIFLGNAVGAYGGPATDNASHNWTDDGVYLDTVAGKIPLQDTMLVANHTYSNVAAQVSGSDAKSVNASVVGWATNPSGSWMPTKVWAPAIDRATGIATGDFTTGPGGSQQFRFDASTVESTSPINDNGQYPGAGNWMSPGEIEDYSVTLQDNVYRVAAKTTGSTGMFSLGGAVTTVSSDKFAFGPVSTVPGTTAATEVVPLSDEWTVADVKIIDTESGADLSDQVNLDYSTSGRDTTITWDVDPGSDVIVQVIFTKNPDVAKSTLTLDKSTATAGSAIKATATIIDPDNQPMQGQVVTFANATSAKTSLSATTCTTDGNGECSITITSNTAGTYTDELSATVMVSGVATDVKGSPKTVIFIASDADPDKSTLTVDPVGSLVVGEATANTFTARTTVNDSAGNPVESETVTYSVTKADGSAVDPLKTKLSATSCVSDPTGKCNVKLTSTQAGSFLIHATVKGADVDNSAATVVYIPDMAHPSVTESDFTVSPVSPISVGSAYTGKATIMDQYGNVLPGVAVRFTTTGDGSLSTDANCTTDRDGVCTAVLLDFTAESVTFAAQVDPGSGFAEIDSHDVEFVAGVADPLKSELAVSSGPLFVGTAAVNTYTATTTVVDSHDNLLTGQTVTYSVTKADGTAVDPAKTSLSADSCKTIAGGTCAVTLTSTAPGIFTITAQISTASGPASVKNSPASVEYKVDKDNPSVSTSTFTVDKTGPLVIDSAYKGTATVADTYGNVIPGVQVTFSTSKSGVVSPVTCTTNDSGVCTATLTDTKAETVSFAAQVKESPSASSLTVIASYNREFTSGPVSPTKSVVTVAPNTQIAGSSVTATVTAHDAYDNPISGLTAADVVLAGVSQTPGVQDAQLKVSGFRDMGNGVYTYQVTSNPAGTYQVSATVKGVVVDQTANVTFTSGGVCVEPAPGVDAQHQTRVVMTVNDQVADGKAQDQAVAYAFDCYGNPVKNASVVITDMSTGVLAGKLTPATSSASTDDSGAVTLAWTSATSGSFTAESTIDGLKPDVGGVLSGDNGIRFSTGLADPRSSTLEVTPHGSIVVGNSFTAKVTVNSKTGNPVTGEVVTFSTDSPDVTLSQATCTTLSTGACSVAVTSKLAGVYSVSAKVSSGGRAVDVVDSPADVEFIAGGVCVTNCTPVDPTHVTRVETTITGSEANGVALDEATAYAYDTFGNPVKDVNVATTTSDTTLTIVTGSAVTDASGAAKLTYSSTKDGMKAADVTVGGKAPDGSPAALSFGSGQADPFTSSVVIRPAVSQTVDSFFDVEATVKDTNGQSVASAVVSFTVDDPDAVLQQTTCTTDSTGTCTVQVTSKIADTYAIHAKIADGLGVLAEITGSPVSAQFTAGQLCVSSEGCVADSGVPKTAVTIITNGAANDDAAQDVVRVSAYDKHGNPVSGVVVSSTTTNGDLHVQANIAATGADGTTTIAYTSLVAGNHAASVLLDGTHTPDGSPVTLAFGSGLGSAADSVFSVSPTGPLTVGQDTANAYTAKATIHDAHGTPAPGVVVTFTADPTGDPVWTSGNTCVTDASGLCEASVVSTKAGTFTVSASITNGPIPSGTGPTGDIHYGVSIAWKTDAVCAAGCTPVDPNLPADKRTRVEVTVDGQVADGDSHDIAAVYAFDKWGNPVQSALVISRTTDSALTIQQGIAATDNAGTSTVWYASNVASTYAADITIDGQAVTGAPVSVTFVPGVPDLGQSAMVVSPTTQAAGSYVTATSTIRDAKGNPIPGVDVTFRVDAHGTLAATVPQQEIGPSTPLVQTLTRTTGPDGKAEVVLTDLTDENVAVSSTIQVNGIATPVDGPVLVKFTAADPCFAPACTPDPSVDDAHRTRVDVTVNNQIANDSDEDTVTAWVFDRYGNAIPGVTVTSDTQDAVLMVGSGSATTLANGSAVLAYTAVEAGDHVVRVKVNNLDIIFVPQSSSVDPAPHSSPVTLTFVPGPADPTQSMVDIDTHSQDVGGFATVTATAKDAMGNAVPNVVVTFTVDNQGRIAAQVPAVPMAINDTLVQTLTAATDANGKAVVVVTDLIAEVDNVSATIISTQAGASVAVPVSGSPQSVTFVAAGLCLAPACTPDPSVDNDHRSRVDITTDNQLSDGIGLNEAMVWAFDMYGNPVTGVKVGAATTDSALTVESVMALTQIDGSAKITFSSTKDGKHVASVTVDGLPVVFVPQPGSALDNPAGIAAHSSPVTLTFAAPPVAPLGGSTITGDALSGAGAVALLALLAVLSMGVFLTRKVIG